MKEEKLEFTYGFYDGRVYDKLWQKVGRKEELTKEEHDYLTFCYHYEEWRAGLL